MKDIITKELLSEVLGKTVSNPRFATSDIMLRYSYGTGFQEINIYELAHKCKEWAKENNIIVSSNQYSVLVTDNSNIRELFKAHTEPEAIFKACQWLLENKD